MTEESQNQQETSLYNTPYSVDMGTFKTTSHFTDYIKRVLSLPKSAQNILTDFSTAEFIEEKLGPNFDLNTDQKRELTRIIRDILLADTFLGDFSTLASQELGVGAETANQIAQKVVNELFAPAIEDIKNMQREKFRDRIAQARSGQMQQPPPAVPRRPAGFVRPGESVQQGNVVDLRNRENDQQ